MMRKKVAVSGGVFAGITAVATVLGLVSDSISLFSKDKKDDTISTVYIAENNLPITEITTEQGTIGQEEEFIVISTEATTEEVTMEETTMPVNPESFYLHNIDPVQSDNFENVSDATDTIGNLYAGNVQTIHSTSSVSGYAIYYAGGKYSSLKGTIAANTNYFGDNQIAIVTILADDEEVYSTGEFNRVSVPMEIDIDITNAQ